jgi:hypothetical protein
MKKLIDYAVSIVFVYYTWDIWIEEISFITRTIAEALSQVK